MKLLLVASLLAVAAAHTLNGIPHVHVGDEVQLALKNVDQKIILNDQFDVILAAAREYMVANGMVPMKLPDSIQGFCVRYLFVDWHGELELTMGTLFDISSISRKGDAEFIAGIQRSHFKAVIGFDILDVKYDYLAKVMNIGPDGGIEARVSDVTFNIDIVYNLLTGDAFVEVLEVLDSGWMRIILTGTAVIDEIFNAIALVITIFFKNDILNLVTAIIKDAINNALTGTGPPTTALGF